MTRDYIHQAAGIVKAIADGLWTSDPPSWADEDKGDWQPSFDEDALRYTRAVQTAEAFIVVFSTHFPAFDRAKFLHACGLGPKPAPKKRS